MPNYNVICLAIDRLHAGYLGAYGNTWINTPAFDALAAQSVLFDRATIDSPQLELLYRSLWLSVHGLCPSQREAGREPLATQFSQAGWQTALLTDDLTVAEHPCGSSFAEHLTIRSSSAAQFHSGQQLASSIEETTAAEFFEEAARWLAAARPPFFLWLHTGSLGRVWDAPLEFRQQYVDEDDPEAVSWADVPNRMLSEQFDPDDLLAIIHAYAGQISMLDQLLGSLLAVITDCGLAENTLLACFSPRGFPLGEHHRVGECDDALYAELTHVPLLLRLPKAISVVGRSQSLVQPIDLASSILDCCGLASNQPSASTQPLIGMGRSFLPLLRGENATGFDRACLTGPNGQHGIVTPVWSLRVSQPGLETPTTESSSAREVGQLASRAELFVKPDDWFEVNEVSDRCPQIVEQLEATFDEFASACRSEQPAPLAPLSDELILGIE